jgi:hypothetical protein
MAAAAVEESMVVGVSTRRPDDALTTFRPGRSPALQGSRQVLDSRCGSGKGETVE